ncbi:class I SAM-dependent methyltransferase [Marinicauda algicola]|uniref:Class I SAM-dependent methyltransferase n=1 Tax=Marinicauda algicola TaxID=2029849 RepID=A0A4S2H552_9PROT|nr:class I SAM-dependent methyltransferase [Marinicauda algicola]TGY90774.1 class I SAM-dependent methyltransferase [Marinicauda algicola]
MSFYHEHILPHLIALTCSQPQIMKKRSQVVPAAEGRVLEVGFGSGTNLEFYDPVRVERLFALEPSKGMRRKARDAVDKSPLEIEWLDLPGEEIPLDDASVDTVVLTYTACTIPDVEAALAQMRRVLKPGGKLLFSEHGRAPDPGVAKWQRRIEPVWKPIAGGCHLTRKPDALIAQAGFRIARMEEGYLPKSPKFAAYNYAGAAVPA